MGKRNPDNCKYIKRCGEPGKDANGMCMGFGRSDIDDEPCEACKKCRFCTCHADDQELVEAENESDV